MRDLKKRDIPAERVATEAYASKHHGSVGVGKASKGTISLYIPETKIDCILL